MTYFVAWLRASSAARNGYPDGFHYGELFRNEFILARRRHAIPVSRLCQEIGMVCATLPVPVPKSEAVGRS